MLSLKAVGQNVVPNGILFQAVARDANNNAASSRNIYAIVNILKGTSSGESVYSESFKVTSSQEGIFTLIIGQGDRISGASSLYNIQWDKSNYYINIKIAIEPTLYNPDWSPAGNYVDIGTSQLWSVPYALSSASSNFADSAITISTVLPSTKGGTGVNNNGKTITIANNIITKGVGDLIITTTDSSNVIFPTSGKLATEEFINSRVASDTVSLSNRISRDSLQIEINKQAYIDTAAAIRLKLNDKIEVAQFPNLIQPFLQNTIFSFSDTLTLSNRIDTKLNIADTSAMLSNRFARDTVSLSNRISNDSLLIKVNEQALIDTAAAIRLKLNDKIEVAQFPNLIQPFLQNTIFSFSDTLTLSNRIDTKLNITDTVNLLQKTDTASMLNNYARKFTKDFTVRLGNMSVGGMSIPKNLGKYVSGQVVPATGKTLDELFDDITTESVAPTYYAPTVSISSNSAATVEMGATFNITLNSSFVQNDAGAATSTTYKSGGTALGGNAESISNLVTSKTYSVEVQYGAGAVKNNNLSVPDPTGKINAGMVTASLSITPKFKKYWGASSSSVPTDAEIIAASSDWGNSNAMSSFNIAISGGAKYIFYAIPTTLSDITSIKVGGFDSYNAFNRITRSVVNASGYTGNYIIYVSKNLSTETISNIIIN